MSEEAVDLVSNVDGANYDMNDYSQGNFDNLLGNPDDVKASENLKETEMQEIGVDDVDIESALDINSQEGEDEMLYDD